MQDAERLSLAGDLRSARCAQSAAAGLSAVAASCIAVVAQACRAAKTPRGRLRELAWCAALLLISVIVLSTLYALFARNDLRWWGLLIPLAAAIVVVVRPRLAARIVPLALILYGLAGFVVARDYVGGGVNTYGLTMVGNPDLEADLILPQAYLFLLLGGWLIWRSADPVLRQSAAAWLG